MSFRVIVTPPPKKGEPTHTTQEALPNREAAGMSALKWLSRNSVSFRIAGLQLGRDIRDAPLGKEIIHEESGYSFRTEEF